MTDSTHTKARIRSISTDRIRQALDEGNIVIAAGFQGIDEAYNITTLGRGGSDTTAVALAAVLGATPAKSTPTWTASTRPIRALFPRPARSADQLRRDARTGHGGGGRDAQPLDRVRQEVLRARPRPQQL